MTVLGATGAVGQKFVCLLANHPWFEVRRLAASERSRGRRYEDVVGWHQREEIPEAAKGLVVQPCRPPLDCPIVFSALSSAVAGKVEEEFASKGCFVFSNARNHRMDRDVPLLIPELNPEHLDILPFQKRRRAWSGALVTNPNCSTIILALSLGPLYRQFGLESVQVVTLQAVSGAGYPGVASLDILGNVIPFIPGEEEKIETEPLKILGTVENQRFEPADFTISAQADRVPVTEGHLECVSVRLRQAATAEEATRCWREFESPIRALRLPSAPRRPVIVLTGKDRPQPRLDGRNYNGMCALVGRVRPCSVLHIKYVVLGHNTIRGAAGASILNAELATRLGRIDSSPGWRARVGSQPS